MYIYFPFFSLVMLKLINFPSFQFSDLSSPSALTSLPSPCRTLFSQVPVNTSPLPNVYFPAPCFIPSTQLPSYLQTMKQIKPSKRLYNQELIYLQPFLYILYCYLHSFIFLVGIFSFSIPYAVFPITIIDVSIWICVFSPSMLFIIFVITDVFEPIRLENIIQISICNCI